MTSFTSPPSFNLSISDTIQEYLVKGKRKGNDGNVNMICTFSIKYCPPIHSALKR